MKRRSENLTDHSDSAARSRAKRAAASALEHERHQEFDPAYCWCGAKKVRHVVGGHPTADYECPYHFMPDHQPGATRGRLFLDVTADR